jgi:hypothetical protein
VKWYFFSQAETIRGTHLQIWPENIIPSSLHSFTSLSPPSLPPLSNTPGRCLEGQIAAVLPDWLAAHTACRCDGGLQWRKHLSDGRTQLEGSRSIGQSGWHVVMCQTSISADGEEKTASPVLGRGGSRRVKHAATTNEDTSESSGI